jgi:hypothetical protein
MTAGERASENASSVGCAPDAITRTDAIAANPSVMPTNRAAPLSGPPADRDVSSWAELTDVVMAGASSVRAAGIGTGQAWTWSIDTAGTSRGWASRREESLRGS